MSIAPWITEPPDVDVEAIIDAEAPHRPAVPDEPVHKPWSIQSPGDAEWAMGRLALTESELAAIESQRAEWQSQLDEWYRTVIRRPSRRKEIFTSFLTFYARRQREADPKAKTLTLPSGKVTSRNNPAKVIVTDHQVVLDWARACAGDCIKEVVRLDELRRLVTVRDGRPVSQDGEVVAGLDVEGEFVSYSVKVAK